MNNGPVGRDQDENEFEDDDPGGGRGDDDDDDPTALGTGPTVVGGSPLQTTAFLENCEQRKNQESSSYENV